MKHIMAVIGCLLALLAVRPAAAQADWFAYVYNWQTHELVQVDASGRATAYSLGLNANAFFSSRDMAFTPDGRRVAFCAVDYGGATPRATLYLRDLAAATNLLQIDFGRRVGCKVTPDSFNAAYSQLAVGLVNAYGPEDPTANPDTPLWELLLLDAASGDIIESLNAGSPALAALEMLPDMAIMPEVRAVGADRILFAEVPYGIGGTPTVSAFAWQFSTGQVFPAPDGPWPHLNSDTLGATGEIAWVAYNPNLPAAEPFGPLGFANVIVLADPTGQERVIYHTADWTVIDTVFIDGGQRLAILLFPAYDPQQPLDDLATRWVALDRSGAVSDLQTNTEFGGGVLAAPDGYAYLRVGYADGRPELARFTLEWHSGGQRRELWSVDGQAWELVWSAPTAPASGLTPFPTRILSQ
jgi:hypothetical protein